MIINDDIKVKPSSRGSNIVNFAETGVLFRTAPPAEREPLPKHVEKRFLPYWIGLEGPRGRKVDLMPLGAVSSWPKKSMNFCYEVKHLISIKPKGYISK